MIRPAARAATVVVAALALTACAPRHTLIQEFYKPAERLQAALYPATVARQRERAPHELEMSVNVQAPDDSALVIVLRHDVALASLDSLVGTERMSAIRSRFAQPGDSSLASPVVGYYSADGSRYVTSTVEVSGLSWPKPQNWVVAATLERRSQQDVQSNARFLVVRPGEELRIHTKAGLRADGVDEDSRYRVRLRWIAVPVGRGAALACGTGPVVLESAQMAVTCGTDPVGYPAVRTVEAQTRMVSTNYLTVAAVTLGLAAVVSIVSRD